MSEMWTGKHFSIFFYFFLKIRGYVKSSDTGVTNSLFRFQTILFPLQINPLESNELFLPSLTRFSTLLEGFFLDAPKLCGYGPLGHHALKTDPFDDHLEVGKTKSVRWIWSLFQTHRYFFSPQELPRAQGVISRCLVVVKQWRLTLP